MKGSVGVFVSGMLVALVGLRADAAAQTILYSNDFEGGVGPEWSATPVEATPIGARRFLGRFCNETVSLALSELPYHTEATVSFDLFMMNSWDGNETRMGWGPDRWGLTVSGGPTLLDTTFNNDHPNSGSYGQAFPDFYSYPDGPQYPPFTGATEIRTLGYEHFTGPGQSLGIMDSVYHLTFTFPHAEDSLALDFSAWNLQNLPDESWGLDNVVVSTNAIPEPCIIVLFLTGAIGVLPYAVRRRKRAA